eukprot:755961-Hanusia_phi.AAC.5
MDHLDQLLHLAAQLSGAEFDDVATCSCDRQGGRVQDPDLDLQRVSFDSVKGGFEHNKADCGSKGLLAGLLVVKLKLQLGVADVGEADERRPQDGSGRRLDDEAEGKVTDCHDPQVCPLH